MERESVRIVEEGVIAYYKGIALSLGGQFHDEDMNFVWFRTGRQSSLRFNGILRARIDIDQLDRVAGPILVDFRKSNLPFFWADFPPGSTPGLEEFLGASGIPLVSKGMPAMIRSLEDVPLIPPLDNVVISKVISSRDQAEWLDVHTEGFGDPPETKPDFKDYLDYSLAHPEWVHFIARCADVPCAISTLLCAKEAAGIYHVTTLPAYRGKGLGRALTLAAMQAGRDSGYSQALLFATPDGYPLYLKLRFEKIITANLYAWTGR